jgi:hypothetical protein
LALVLVTACGGGDGSDTEESGDTGTETTTGDDGEESLADFFGYGDDDPEAAQARYVDEESTRQELIRACMAEEGFDYTPVQPPEDSFQVFGPEDEEERVRTQGFGVTTWYGNEEQFDRGIEWEDPNQEMIDAMSESERTAYQEALYGTEEEQMEGATTETDPETGEEYTMVEGFGAGCDGEASEEVYGDQNQVNELWEELGPQMEAMYERVQADPRIVDFNVEWAECMAEAGFDYESRDDMYETVFDDFQARMDELVGPNGGFGDPFEGWSEAEIEAFFEEKTEDEINAFFEEAQDSAQSDVDEEALAALQQEEIDLAVADFECGSDFNDLYTEVSADYEADFIEENRDLLEQVRDAQGG